MKLSLAQREWEGGGEETGIANNVCGFRFLFNGWLKCIDDGQGFGIAVDQVQYRLRRNYFTQLRNRFNQMQYTHQLCSWSVHQSPSITQGTINLVQLDWLLGNRGVCVIFIETRCRSEQVQEQFTDLRIDYGELYVSGLCREILG